MSRETVKLDLDARGLGGYVLFGDPRNKPNVVVITHGRDTYATFLQDDRAQVTSTSVREFAREEDALADFVHRIELWNRITGVR